MKVLIIEDEKLAANRLEKVLLSIDSTIDVLAKLDSIKKSVQWLQENSEPELIFMDIHLADGLSFDIFDRVEILSPVIFTTAYDEYALRAFKVNSIDYLLKPIDKDEVQKAFEKMRSLKGGKSLNSIAQIAQAMDMLSNKYKSRFMIKVGEHIKSIPIESITYFFSREKATFCHTLEARNFIIDYSLEELEDLLDPETFFRINRKYIISCNSYTDIISFSNSRLKIVLEKPVKEDVIVSRDRVAEFKKWLDQ